MAHILLSCAGFCCREKMTVGSLSSRTWLGPLRPVHDLQYFYLLLAVKRLPRAVIAGNDFKAWSDEISWITAILIINVFKPAPDHNCEVGLSNPK